MSYLQVSSLPSDTGDIMKNVADDLLLRKYNYEKLVSKLLSGEILDKPLPELTVANKQDLESLKGQSVSIEEPAFNFDLDTLEGGYD